MSYARRHSTNVCPGNRVRYSVAELGIREYIRRKEPEEKKHEQLELNLPQAPSRGLHQTAPSGGGS